MNCSKGIKIFTGNGKGKTTGALGLALKAVDDNRRVLIIQFMKPPGSSGEHFAAEAFDVRLSIVPMGKRGFIRKNQGESSDNILAAEALEEAKNCILSGNYDVVILDEVNVAVYMGLVQASDLLKIVNAKPESVELVLTGRYALADLLTKAETVYEAIQVKHPFEKRLPAQKGIEY